MVDFKKSVLTMLFFLLLIWGFVSLSEYEKWVSLRIDFWVHTH